MKLAQKVGGQKKICDLSKQNAETYADHSATPEIVYYLNMQNQFFKTIFKQRILAAVNLNATAKALAVAEVFMKADLTTFEIPLRNKEALNCIKEIKRKYPELNIGAGTILTTEQLKEAMDAGAGYALSPGFNLKIAQEAQKLNFPFIPGVMTPSDIEMAYENGYDTLKVFPIAAIGGLNFLKAMDGPYGHLNLKYIPMGGINAANVADYLNYPNVLAVGGSWLATEQMITDVNFPLMEQHIQQALAISQKSIDLN